MCWMFAPQSNILVRINTLRFASSQACLRVGRAIWETRWLNSLRMISRQLWRVSECLKTCQVLFWHCLGVEWANGSLTLLLKSLPRTRSKPRLTGSFGQLPRTDQEPVIGCFGWDRKFGKGKKWRARLVRRGLLACSNRASGTFLNLLRSRKKADC